MPELTQRDADEFRKQIEELKDNRDLTDNDALELSALKWDLIAVNLITPLGPHNCALCIMHAECRGCPVAADIGIDGCSNTPHDAWLMSPTPENARKEADYLRSLRTKVKADGT